MLTQLPAAPPPPHSSRLKEFSNCCNLEIYIITCIHKVKGCSQKQCRKYKYIHMGKTKYPLFYTQKKSV